MQAVFALNGCRLGGTEPPTGFGDNCVGRIAFVEVKAPGGKVRKIQQVRHRQLRKMGFKVFVLDDPNYIPMIIEEIKAKE